MMAPFSVPALTVERLQDELTTVRRRDMRKLARLCKCIRQAAWLTLANR
jgi:hypothetical protein